MPLTASDGNQKFHQCFTRKATGFHRQAKPFELNLFTRKLSSRWSNQASKIILTACKFAQCSALNETPAYVFLVSLCLPSFWVLNQDVTLNSSLCP